MNKLRAGCFPLATLGTATGGGTAVEERKGKCSHPNPPINVFGGLALPQFPDEKKFIHLNSGVCLRFILINNGLAINIVGFMFLELLRRA